MSASQEEIEAERFNAYLRTKDHEEFAWLYKRFHPRMIRAAKRLLNGDPSGEDCAQNSWIIITKMTPQPTPIISPTAFLVTIVQRQAKKYLKKMKRLYRDMVSLESLAIAVSGEGDGDGDEDTLYIVDEVGEEVRWLEEHWDLIAPALDTISPINRAAVEHVFIDGQTAVEASNQLNVPLGTVQSRAWRGMKELNLALGA